MSDQKNTSLSSFQYAAAGAFSGFVTRFTCQPLDVLKILFQLQVDPKSSSKYTSIIQAITVLVREEGIPALWKGHVPAQLLSIAYGAIQFSTYERIMKLKYQFENKNDGQSINARGFHFYAGGASGVIAMALSFPFDTIRTRLIAQHRFKLYKGVYDAGRKIWMQEGLKGFYQGVLPACSQIALASGFVFGFKNIYTQIWNQCTIGLPYSSQVTAKGHMLTGLLAGITSKLLIYPLDVIKKRLQIQGMDKSSLSLKSVSNPKGVISCLVLIMKNEGFTGFYKGITPALIKSGMGNAINFTVYHETCQFLDYISS